MPNKLQKIADINTYWITNWWEHMENCHGSVVHIKILDRHWVHGQRRRSNPKKGGWGRIMTIAPRELANAESRIGLHNHPWKQDIVCWTIGNIGQLSMGSPADEDIFRSHPAPISSHHYHRNRHHPLPSQLPLPPLLLLVVPKLLLPPLLPLLLLLLPPIPSQSARVCLISQGSYNNSDWWDWAACDNALQWRLVSSLLWQWWLLSSLWQWWLVRQRSLWQWRADFIFIKSATPPLSYLKRLSVSCKKKGARSKMRGG